MPLEKKNPAAVAAPVGPYSHLVRVGADVDWVILSGQVGLDETGDLPLDVYAQTVNVFANIERLLASERLGPEAIAKILTLAVSPEQAGEFRRARDEAFARWFPTGDHPAQSLAYVAGLARPEMLIEVEVWAVAPRA